MTFHSSSDGVNGEDDRVPLWPNATAKVLTALLTTLSSTTPTPTQQLHPVGALWSTSTPASSPPAMAGTPDLAWLALFNYSFVTGTPPGGTNFTGSVHPPQNDSLPYDLLELDRCDPGNAHFECSVQDFLEYARGPQQMPLSTALLVSRFSESKFTVAFELHLDSPLRLPPLRNSHLLRTCTYFENGKTT